MAKSEIEQPEQDGVNIEGLTKEERKNATQKIAEHGVVDFIEDTFGTSYDACVEDDDDTAWATLHHYRRTLIGLITSAPPDPTIEEVCSWLVSVSAAAASLAGITTGLFDGYANAAPAETDLVKVAADGVNLLKRALDEDLKEVVEKNEEAN